MTISARTILGVTRALVGLLSVLAPHTSIRLFGVPEQPGVAWVTRLFGSRELALAATLLAVPDEQVAPVAALGAGIDGVDAVSSVVEFARGRISTYTFVSGGFGALFFALLGVLSARSARAVTTGPRAYGGTA